MSENPIQRGAAPSAGNPETIPGAAVGLALLAGFTALLLGVGISLCHDRIHRHELETVEQTTAVGDTAFFSAPEEAFKTRAEVARYNGKPLRLASPRRTSLEDTEVRVLGRDDTGRFFLYEPEDKAIRAGPEGQVYYYVKCDAGAYMKLELALEDQ